ncbi:MAG: ATP synthase F1 subunit epsilon, partial [Actinomycetota bacterium]|nr:ATP synthase F1 subunit epsilon [Actinomycetota bacterium]
VSAEKRLFQGEANEVYARSLEGEIGILPGHQPALLTLDIAPVRINLADGGQETVAVHHGFLYFQDNELVVLADMAELESELDEQRAERDIERYEERLSKEEDAETRAALRRAKARREATS